MSCLTLVVVFFDNFTTGVRREIDGPCAKTPDPSPDPSPSPVPDPCPSPDPSPDPCPSPVPDPVIVPVITLVGIIRRK